MTLKGGTLGTQFFRRGSVLMLVPFAQIWHGKLYVGRGVFVRGRARPRPIETHYLQAVSAIFILINFVICVLHNVKESRFYYKVEKPRVSLE